MIDRRGVYSAECRRSLVNGKISGYYTPGTFAQYATFVYPVQCRLMFANLYTGGYSGPARYVTPIPDGLDSAAAAPLLCAGVSTGASPMRADVH